MAKPKRPRSRREATFLEHLEELRRRLIRCAIYVALAAALTWVVRQQLMEIAQWPILQAGDMAGVGPIEFKAFGPAEALVLTFQIALVAGVILASPLWLLEAWAFIEPALEDHERKWVMPLLPFAVFLFVGGVAFCYWMCPRAFAILLHYQKSLHVAPEFILKDYLTFFLRLLLIFGVMFELPLVIMFLSAVGIVKSSFLAKHWRIAVVLIAVICAIVTPTPDAVTLSFLAGPMVGLYLLSIVLARFVEKGRSRSAGEEESAEAGSAPAASVPEPSALPEHDPYAVYRDDAHAEAPESEGGPADEAGATEAHEAVNPPAAFQESDEEALRAPEGTTEETPEDPEALADDPAERDRLRSRRAGPTSQDDPPTDGP